MAGMTFLQLQDSVMGDRFDESQRGDVKNWLNAAYWGIWTMEEWTFRYATASVSVTQGSQVVGNLPADLASVRSFQRGDGTPLSSMQQVDFERVYNDPRSTVTGLPEQYTVIDGAVLVGPASSETASDYFLVYEKEYTPLVNDFDVPLIPEGAHVGGLVFEATAIGLQTQNDFTWQFFQQQSDRTMDTLRRGYLADRRDANQTYAPDPISQIY